MRYPCDRLAAFTAHCLNSEDLALVRVNSGALYAELTEALAVRYAEPLLHHPAYAWRLSAEEAAARYFDVSYARRLLLSGKVALSMAHRLFEALCRRGVEPEWHSATLQREAITSTDNVLPLSRQNTFARCARELSRLPEALSPGSASPTIRARCGAIILQVGALKAPVPEEMSVWDAITCGPDALHPLSMGEPFNRFCGLMIDCVRTAHRPFQEILGLGSGLCPFDWLDVLTIQQTRALRKFLGVIEASARGHSPSSWAAAWDEAQVPGFKSADHLWQSEIGLALRHALTDLETEVAIDEQSGDGADFLSAEEFRCQLELLLGDGVINAAESRVLMQLHQGARLAELATRIEVRTELHRRGVKLEQWLSDLQGRIEQWSRWDDSR
jgi:hypothetical protein